MTIVTKHITYLNFEHAMRKHSFPNSVCHPQRTTPYIQLIISKDRVMLYKNILSTLATSSVQTFP